MFEEEQFVLDFYLSSAENKSYVIQFGSSL